MSDEPTKRRKAFIAKEKLDGVSKLATKTTTKRVQIPLDSATLFLLELLLIKKNLKKANYISLLLKQEAKKEGIDLETIEELF